MLDDLWAFITASPWPTLPTLGALLALVGGAVKLLKDSKMAVSASLTSRPRSPSAPADTTGTLF